MWKKLNFKKKLISGLGSLWKMALTRKWSLGLGVKRFEQALSNLNISFQHIERRSVSQKNRTRAFADRLREIWKIRVENIGILGHSVIQLKIIYATSVTPQVHKCTQTRTNLG